jgi:hypothetical protein
MSATIYPLPTPSNLARADAVETLERYLERAKSGEIVTVAIAAVNAEGTANFSYSQQVNGVSLLGAVALLQHDLTAALIREADA